MSLRFEEFEIPSAKLGMLNPLPDISGNMDAHSSIDIDTTTVTAEESRYMGYAPVHSMLPYLEQDGYDRVRKPKAWKAAILENEYLKAVFIPQLGGRLWSLYDKREERELLHRNPVFQPCNLALRNAWFSGGVEWNIGVIGHTYYTCDRMYCEALSFSDGTPVLRMYQYERIRGLIYRVEAFLPDDSRQLFVRIRIDNAHDTPTAVYWWSNIAVDERDDVRVIVPARKAYQFGYGGKLRKVDVPYLDGIDHSHTTNVGHAMDFFFDLDAGKPAGERLQRRWISAIGGDGRGFAQSSTDALQGRKLFMWGMGAGGRNWQTFLSQPGSQYIEIQAGLAHTQLEHLPLEGGGQVSWLESYGAINVDGAVAQGADYDAAISAVEAELERTAPRVLLEEYHDKCRAELDGKVGELRQMGAGWARLDQEAEGESFDAKGLRFPIKALKQPERQWLQLIERGTLPRPHPLDEPLGYQIGARWRDLMTRALKRDGDNWYLHYQLGVNLAQVGKLDKARASFENSIKRSENPWALYCLARLDEIAGDMQSAAQRAVAAVQLKPEYHLALCALRILLAQQKYMGALDVYNRLPAAVRRRGRVKVCCCQALIATGAFQRAEQLLLGDIELSDVREGENRLSDMWLELQARREAQRRGVEYSDALLAELAPTIEIPTKLDFRMK